MSPKDKVWIYTSPSPLNDEQVAHINSSAEDFLDQWKSHGDKLYGIIEIKYNQFVVITADHCDGNLCGRAQDAQLKWVKSISDEIGVNLLDRTLVPIKEGESIKVLELNDFKQAVKSGNITGVTPVFNNLVASYKDYTENWETTAEQSWHKQFLV